MPYKKSRHATKNRRHTKHKKDVMLSLTQHLAFLLTTRALSQVQGDGFVFGSFFGREILLDLFFCYDFSVANLIEE